jgi:hypothetical protein
METGPDPKTLLLMFFRMPDDEQSPGCYFCFKSE